ncbi:MAG: hypothetical protein ACXABG_10515 [Promethearchaeota archaeon]|jgi:hypothetical protein
MRKQLKAILIIIPVLIAAVVTLTFILPYFKQPSTTSNLGAVRIYVNSTLAPSISTEVNQYEQDVINQGYTVQILNWSDTNVTVLRNDLINASMQPQGLKGAVLIGDLPSAILRYYDSFWSLWRNYPCDLYLDHLTAYRNYFARNHAYRTGQLTRPDSQLVYIDDDWSAWTSEWLGDMTAYTNITCISTDSTTTATDYKTRLTHTYEFVHVFVHSWPYEHLFGPGGYGAEGKVNYTNILDINTRALFYNLFACSAANFEYQNNLGTQYLFSNNTLVVVGSSKIGGMTMNSYFYTPLRQGKVFGEAMRLWYWNPLHGPSDPDSIGMTLLGDPLLTI